MRERILAPSILSADFANLGSDIQRAANAGAKYLHIDVMDGLFVPRISFGMPIIQSIRRLTNITFDVHLMIVEPERYLAVFREMGADSLTVHIETLSSPETTLKTIRGLGAKVGISLNPETPVEKIFPYLDLVDLVMVMTVRPGIGGQKYIHECTPKIEAVAGELAKRGLADKVDIEVDGGIDENTIDEALNAGANVIVAGTAVFGEDIEGNAKALMAHF